MVPAAELVHHDLVTVPRGRAQPGIYWLRLWQTGHGHVAAVTEVPGNAGLSVSNGISLIESMLVTDHGVNAESLRLFALWPPGSLPTRSEPRYYLVDPDPMNRWPEVAYAEIEDTVGGDLPPLPEHEELYAQVLAAGGGRHELIERPLFAVVPVDDIPCPHHPYKCRYAERFKAIRDDVQDLDADRDALEELVGRRFLDSLSRWDRVRCRYHWARWRAIADESVRILSAAGPADTDEYMKAAERSRLRGRNRGLLQSLFDDPVVVAGGGFTNGQHRGCALRFSGATHAALVVGDAQLGVEEIIWTYVGGG